MKKSMPFCLVMSILCLVILLVFLIIGCFFVARVARKQERKEKHARRMKQQMLMVGTEMVGMKAPEEEAAEEAAPLEKEVIVYMP